MVYAFRVCCPSLVASPCLLWHKCLNVYIYLYQPYVNHYYMWYRGFTTIIMTNIITIIRIRIPVPSSAPSQ